MKTKHKAKKQEQPEKPTLSLKEQLAEKRQRAKARAAFVQFTTFAVMASCLLGTILFTVGGIKAAAGGAIGLFTISMSYRYPRQALWVLMIYMPFAGTITYTIGGGNALFQLAKDAFYIPALLGLLAAFGQQRKPFWEPKSLQVPVLVLLLVCSFTFLFINLPQQFDPRPGEQPLALGLLGFKVFVGYIPLIFCTYHLLRTKKELLFLTRTHVVLAIICCALAFVQYYMLSSGRCQGTRGMVGADLFKASLQARCFVGGALLYSPDQGVIRLPGTFVAPWQWGWFLIANAYFTFATAFSDPQFRWRTTGMVGMAAVFVMAVLSGQRIALLLVPASYALLTVLTGQFVNLKRFIPVGIGLGIFSAIGASMYPEIIQSRIDSFVARWNAAPADEFILTQLEVVMWKLDGSLVGRGLGRATNSARVFGDTFLLETWFPKVLYEVGPIGLIAFLILVTAITIQTFRAYRSVKEKNLRSYGACFWVFVLFISYNTYYYPLDVDPVAIYYWIFAGAILKLPELDRQERLLNPDAILVGPSKRRRKKPPTPPPDEGASVQESPVS